MMSNTVLVTYATRAGSTQEIAEVIAQTLNNHGLTVNLQAMQDVHSVSDYDAVIAGSAIRIDKILPEAKQFIERYQHELSQKPFAPFIVCLAMSQQDERRHDQAIARALNYLKPVRDLVPTISEGLFAGVLDLSKLSLAYRLLFGAVTLTGIFKEGDYRDWDAIEHWADELSNQLIDAPILNTVR